MAISQKEWNRLKEDEHYFMYSRIANRLDTIEHRLKQLEYRLGIFNGINRVKKE